jgi:hypothetical protein
MGALLLAMMLGLPGDLAGTGYYELAKTPFEPQYPLWTDGAAKRRWIHLPPGTAIDKSNPEAWEFPRGTRLWKEFALDGRVVETRFIQRQADGSWRYATYLWNAQGTQATLAPEDGAQVGAYVVPSRSDCVTCHEGPAVPVLGYSATQLESRLPGAAGYLHGNCGHCHNERALPGLDFALAHEPTRAEQSLARTKRGAAQRAELIAERMSSHNASKRMPPLGVQVPDANGLSLIQRWIKQEKP